LGPLLDQLTRLRVQAGVQEILDNRDKTSFQGDEIEWDSTIFPGDYLATNPPDNPPVIQPPAHNSAPDMYMIQESRQLENFPLCLPSNGATNGLYRQEELELCIFQAESQLTHLRDLIADKSFHFSDLIRPATSKDIKTRARTAVDGLNTRIAFHARMYNRARARMIALGAEADLLMRYQFLEKEHTKSSTAVLDFNTPGSSNIKLSWIWQTVRTRLGPDLDDPAFSPPEDPATMLECK